MTPEDKLIITLKSAIRDNASCGGVIWWATIEIFEQAVEEYESAPKPWVPPWPLKVPDWPEVWLIVYLDGYGEFVDHKVYPSDVHPWWNKACCDNWCNAGYFEIPPGVDWRTMKVRVR